MLNVGHTFETSHAAISRAGLVGPNAVLQLIEALRDTPDRLALIFERAGCLRHLTRPPKSMIDEAIPALLFDALWSELPPEEAATIALDAGHRVGAYVHDNRIPAFARALLRILPASLSTRLLLKAISKNAWTFAGSGHCEAVYGRPSRITITNNPLKMPGNLWHVGVFETLFGRLVRGKVKVIASTMGVEDRFEVWVG